MNNSSVRRVAVIGGDGIGIEVTCQARRILEAAAKLAGIALEIEDHDYGALAYRKTGKVLPAETEQALHRADAIIFGATGGPEFDEIPIAERRAGSLLKIRSALQLYANLRPVLARPALFDASSLKERALRGVDMVIVRELVGGIYFGAPRGIEKLADGQRRGVNTQVYTTNEIHRVARDAFELARTRRGRVCSVDKANVMESGVLWREEVQAIHDREFPDVELSHIYVDNCAMQIVRAPSQFDVMVTDNLFGDILSDCAAMVTGSLGMLPSASLGPKQVNGRRAAFYEPVHGSAPDIAGQDIANPLGAILSVAMAFRYSLDAPRVADMIEGAVTRALDKGARTADIASDRSTAISCTAMGDSVLAELA
jgi:3-isopropylmalate dehydrogenase